MSLLSLILADPDVLDGADGPGGPAGLLARIGKVGRKFDPPGAEREIQPSPMPPMRLLPVETGGGRPLQPLSRLFGAR
jgi:hypothetical protein